MSHFLADTTLNRSKVKIKRLCVKTYRSFQQKQYVLRHTPALEKA